MYDCMKTCRDKSECIGFNFKNDGEKVGNPNQVAKCENMGINENGIQKLMVKKTGWTFYERGRPKWHHIPAYMQS